MSSIKEAIRRPYDFIQSASDEFNGRNKSTFTRPMSIGGIIFLALGLAAFIWMYPELQRYLRIRRM